MRLGSQQLAAFWVSAAQQRPLIILGAGRWGRTLTEVAAKARGGVKNLALIARSNYASTCEWSALDPLLESLLVSRDLASTLEKLSAETQQQPLAIVASRPRDHFLDTRACLALGLDTLVEKPLVSNPDDAIGLLQTAAAKDRVLALGVELSLTPVFHYAANYLSGPVVRARLEWADPVNELRHGQVKRVHDEVHILEDNLPHAVSIFRIFASEDASFSLTAAHLDSSGDRGAASLACGEAQFFFNADRAAVARLRQLRMETADGREIEVDFSTPQAILWIDGQHYQMPGDWTRLTSTLRLEIGAFFEHAVSRAVHTPLTHNLPEYARLHAALRDALV